MTSLKHLLVFDDDDFLDKYRHSKQQHVTLVSLRKFFSPFCFLPAICGTMDGIYRVLLHP